MTQETTNTNSTIVSSWSLLAFARSRGPRMQVGESVNKKTGDKFTSCIFTSTEGDRTFCAFSQKLGKLTSSQIAARKDQLQVVQLESGHFVLCEQGNAAWEDVDLGL